MPKDPSRSDTLPVSRKAHAVRPSGSLKSPAVKASQSVRRKRLEGALADEKSLARSKSTPQLKTSTMSDDDADKKRNKLTYHRISIACVHCRHRKIRCEPIEPEGTICKVCRKLNKTCVFQPVEESESASAAKKKKAKKQKKTESDGAPSAPSSTVSSPPPPDFIHAIGQQDGSFCSFPISPPSTFDGVSIGDQISQHGSYAHPGYTYGTPEDASAPWAPHIDTLHGSIAPAGSAPTSATYLPYGVSDSANMYNSYTSAPYAISGTDGQPWEASQSWAQYQNTHPDATYSPTGIAQPQYHPGQMHGLPTTFHGQPLAEFSSNTSLPYSYAPDPAAIGPYGAIVPQQIWYPDQHPPTTDGADERPG